MVLFLVHESLCSSLLLLSRLFTCGNCIVEVVLGPNSVGRAIVIGVDATFLKVRSSFVFTTKSYHNLLTNLEPNSNTTYSNNNPRLDLQFALVNPNARGAYLDHTVASVTVPGIAEVGCLFFF